jgi:hypothetical protein
MGWEDISQVFPIVKVEGIWKREDEPLVLPKITMYKFKNNI